MHLRACFAQLRHVHYTTNYLKDEYNKNPRYTYFEKQYEQMFPLDVQFFSHK